MANTQLDPTLPTDAYIESAFPVLDRKAKTALISALDTGKLLPNDLKVSNNAVTPLKKVDVSGSGMIVSDGTGLFMLDAVSVTADVTVAGLNGLDTGAQAASTTYYVYVIYNSTSNTIGSLLSISTSAPTMPAGYTFKKRVGSNTTDTSTNFSGGWTSDIPSQFPLLNSQTATVDVTNTLTETNLYSVSLPTNTLTAGRMLQLNVWGDMLKNAVGTLQIKVKLGATTIFDSAAQTPVTSASRQISLIEARIFANAVNSQTNEVRWKWPSGVMVFGITGTVEYGGGPVLNETSILAESSSTEDNSAGARVLAVTATWSVASVSLSARTLGVKTVVFP